MKNLGLFFGLAEGQGKGDLTRGENEIKSNVNRRKKELRCSQNNQKVSYMILLP